METVAHCTLAERTFGGEEITYYTAKGIFLRAEAYGELRVTRPERLPLRYLPAELAHQLKQGVDAAFPEDAAPLIRALTTGNRDNLTDHYTSSLQRTGLSHTVAVSGMHLSFLAALVSGLLGGKAALRPWSPAGWCWSLRSFPAARPQWCGRR